MKTDLREYFAELPLPIAIRVAYQLSRWLLVYDARLEVLHVIDPDEGTLAASRRVLALLGLLSGEHPRSVDESFQAIQAAISHRVSKEITLDKGVGERLRTDLMS